MITIVKHYHVLAPLLKLNSAEFRTMEIKVPGPCHGLNTADVVIEQILLCQSVIQAIRKVSQYRTEREVNDEINRRLRTCFDFLGMAGSRKDGCLYNEKALVGSEEVVYEHAIPVTALVSLYLKGFPLQELVFYPVVRLSKKSDTELRRKGLAKTGHDLNYVFRRYHHAGIKVQTYSGEVVPTDSWTLRRHEELLRSTPLYKVKQEILRRLRT